MRILKLILCMLVAIFSLTAVMAPSSLPYFLLGDGHTALVPVDDIAKWLHIDSSWNQSEKTAILSNSLHQLKLYDNSTAAFLDGKAMMLDFPSVSFEGKLFVQPKIFHTFNNFTIYYQSPENFYYSFETRLRLTNTETRSTLIFALADLLYHMRADFIGDGKWEDVFGTRSFHTRVWIMRQQNILWHDESFSEGENIALLFGVYACNLVSPKTTRSNNLLWCRCKLYR